MPMSLTRSTNALSVRSVAAASVADIAATGTATAANAVSATILKRVEKTRSNDPTDALSDSWKTAELALGDRAGRRPTHGDVARRGADVHEKCVVPTGGAVGRLQLTGNAAGRGDDVQASGGTRCDSDFDFAAGGMRGDLAINRGCDGNGSRRRPRLQGSV